MRLPISTEQAPIHPVAPGSFVLGIELESALIGPGWDDVPSVPKHLSIGQTARRRAVKPLELNRLLDRKSNENTLPRAIEHVSPWSVLLEITHLGKAPSLKEWYRRGRRIRTVHAMEPIPD